MMTPIERQAVRASRFESWALVLALAVLLAFAIAFGVALVPKGQVPRKEADDGPGSPGLAYRAEQPVQAWHGGRWYPAHVHSVSAGRYFITYDDFSISWNEWVTARRLRAR
jgi:hypothetical protein